MAKFFLLALLIINLSGCAHKLDNNWLYDFLGTDNKPATYNFDWQMTGDSSLLPLQVFDNGNKLWLQYASTATIPAFFKATPQGDIFLKPQIEAGYLVFNQVPDSLLIRGGKLSAELTKTKKAYKTADIAINQEQKNDLTNNAMASPAVTLPVALASDHAISAPTISPKKPSPKQKSNSKRLATVSPEYSVSPNDINIRKALKNWSQRVDWTFTDEHWAVDVDIPIAGSASFGANYQSAVRNLLAATELGDRPLQPCFYSNKVLRIVPYAQRCDRTIATGATL